MSVADSAAGLGPRRKSESDLAAAAVRGRAESDRLDFRDPCFIERQVRLTCAQQTVLALDHKFFLLIRPWPARWLQHRHSRA